jgi:hypothetical protein
LAARGVLNGKEKKLDLAYLPIWQDQGGQEYLPVTWEQEELTRFNQVNYIQLEHVETVSLGFHASGRLAHHDDANSKNIAWLGTSSDSSHYYYQLVLAVLAIGVAENIPLW